MTPSPRREAPWASAVIAGATVSVAFSAIFIRLAGDDAGTIVWLRMSLAAALLAPWAARSFRGTGRRLGLRRAATFAVSGVLLGAHFLLWTASLAMTSIAASVLLVSLHPVIVLPLGARLHHDRIPPRAVAGGALAMIGTVVTAGGDVTLGPRALTGDAFAVGGAVCLAGYLLIGRGVRASTGTAAYSAPVFAIAAVVGAVAAAAGGAPHMPTPRTAALCLALAVVSTLGGHAAFNWALRFVGAAVVSVAFLGEAPLATLLGIGVFRTIPALATLIGGAVILGGVGLTLFAAGGDAPQQEW